jgi:DNA-binding NarL/FixJ family response regulator
MTHPNPWNLTPRESEVLSALAERGSSKVVAKQIGVSYRTVEKQVRDAKLRMGLEHRTQAIVAWDRWSRDQA